MQQPQATPTDSRATGSGLTALLEALEGCKDSTSICENAVAEALSAAELTAAELDRSRCFSPEKYTRNKLARTPDFDVLLICWEPGQETRIHDHSGQRGWVRVLEGAIEEVAYDFSPLDDVEVPEGCSVAACRLHEAGRALVPAGPAVARVDPVRAIHQLRNPLERGERAVTLHVYSKPHDSCMTYDLEQRTSERMELVTD